MLQFVVPELPGEWTVEDLGMLPEDGHRYEIIDGALCMSPRPPAAHQSAVGELGYLLRLAAPAPVEVLSRIGVDLGRSMFVPDLVVIDADIARSGAALAQASDLRLVIEIESPASVSMDRLVKPVRYAEAGIPSYWRAELRPEPTIAIHDLDGDRYRVTATVRAGDQVEVDRPFRVAIAPAQLLRH